jgi:hypothetical protein
MIATRNGIEGIFSEKDWKTGIPQKHGWIKQGETGKVLPKDLVGIVFDKEKKIIDPIGAKPETVVIPKSNIGEIVAKDVKQAIENEIAKVKIESTVKKPPIKNSKRNDHPKQKRGTAKH